MRLYPYALRALAKLANLRYAVILVSNQSAIRRGLVSRETVNEINLRLTELIVGSGGRLDGIYICPHAPWENCACRKPQPGMLLQAAEEHGLDLSNSWMIGDALSDLEAAARAGVVNRIMVLTGRGRRQSLRPVAANLQPLQLSANLWTAVRTIMEQE